MPDGNKCLSLSHVSSPSSVPPVEAAQQNVRLADVICPDNGLIDGEPNFYAANLFLLQYFLTVIPLYIMFTRVTRAWATLAKAMWAKAAFNLLLYIHGAHII
ncbi:hypothetical protein EZV62_009074 [Acer yangbiense]|uniref:Uncharacterized protein n=1 Tax=Acer yangbiense TaxID=1000413 RepID=A0A5C7IFM0_9ROSI|nr:hypothetical protein EZV62_009074 [Acer yangbiense]